jgi:phage host-nuclease inhibitor protein Gam
MGLGPVAKFCACRKQKAIKNSRVVNSDFTTGLFNWLMISLRSYSAWKAALVQFTNLLV